MVTLLSMAGVFSVAPALPYIAEAMNLAKADIGYIITAFTLGNVLVVVFIGILSDKIGRKAIIIPSLLLFGSAGFLSGFVDSFQWLLFWRFLQGMGSAAFGTLTVAMISDLYQGQERVKYFSYNMVVNSLGMTLFPFLGGLLVMYSWRYPFYISAVAIPFAIYIYFVLRYEEKRSELDIDEYLRSFLISLKDPRVLRAAYLNFTAFVMMGGGFLTFYALFLAENYPPQIDVAGYQLSREIMIGSVMSVFSVMVGVVSSQLGNIHARFGFHRVLSVAFLCYAGSFYLFQASENLLTVLLAVIWFGAGHGIAAPSLIALFTKIAPEGMVGSYVTINSLVFRLGQTLGPLLMVFVYAQSSIHTVFVVAGSLAFPAAVVAFITSWKRSDGSY